MCIHDLVPVEQALLAAVYSNGGELRVIGASDDTGAMVEIGKEQFRENLHLLIVRELVANDLLAPFGAEGYRLTALGQHIAQQLAMEESTS